MKKALPISRILTFLLLLFLGVESSAQDIIPTKGKEFWVGFMQNYETENTEELNLFIVSDQPTNGVVEIPNQGWSQSFNVVPNQTTTVTIPNNLAEHFTSQIVENKGIFVQTQDTVAVFAINFNGFTADGTKILPVNSLGIDYRISSYQGLGAWGSEFVVVATEDDTEIEIVPSEATLDGDPAGVPFTVQLDEGESYQVKVGNNGDFTGTTIKGTEASGDCRPFAVFSGTSCVNIPIGCSACDHIFEQNFSVDTWGTEFYIVPFSFATSYTYRVMADQDNTQVTINGGAAIPLNAGEFVEYNDVPDVQCVQANQGISVTQYMEGVGCAGAGDPAMLILNDATQKIDNITFSTVNSTVITEHGLNVIIDSGDIGSLQLDGATVSVADFSPFPDCPSHSFAQIDITEGSHTLDAPNGFTAYVYGTGNAESYAYSVGSFKFTDPILVDTVLCQSGEVNLGVNEPWNNIYWYGESDPTDTLEMGNQLTLIPPYNTDIYVAVGEQFVSGCEEYEYFSVENIDPPLFTAFPDGVATICEYQEIQLGVDLQTPGTYFYTWTPANTLSASNINNPVASPLSNTTYEVLVSSLSGCSFATDTVVVEVIGGDVTNFDVTAEDELICLGESTQLNLLVEESVFEDNFDPNISWGVWSDIANGISSDNCGSVTDNALYFDGAGNRHAETIDLDMTNGGTVRFSLKIANGVAPCDDTEIGDDVVLEYSTNAGGNWTIIQTYFEALYNNFTIVEQGIPAAAETAATRFRWRQLQNSGAGTDNWALDDVAIGVENPNAFDILWNPSTTLDFDDVEDPIATPLLETMYIATVVDNFTGCVYEDSVFINVGEPFTLTMTPDMVLCDAQGVDIEAVVDQNPDDDYTYLWSPDNGSINNPFSDSPTVTPVATTVYEVEVTSEQGCSAEGEVEIIVNALLSLDVTTDNDDFCEGEVANLNALIGGGGGLTYEWLPDLDLDDNSIPNPAANPSDDITYTLTVTDDMSGCVLTESIDLTVFEGFTVDAGPDLELCEVLGTQLNAVPSTNDALSWTWTQAANLDSWFIPNPTIAVDETAEYIVTATNNADCSATDTVMVELLFESFTLGDDVILCEGESAFIATGYDDSIDHDWSNNETTPEIEVTQSGVFEVVVTSPEGCTDSDEIEVTVQPLPVVDLGVDPGLCEGEVHPLDAGNPGLTYEWNTTEITQNIDATTTGTYSVQVTDQFNCVGVDEIDLVFNLNPVINLPETVTICEDEFATLDAENPGSMHAWSTLENTQMIDVNLPGDYSVTVTNAFNCASSDNTTLITETYPVVDLGVDQASCAGETITLDAGNPGMNYNWSSGDTTQTADAFATGIYTVQVDNGYCFTSDDVSLVFNPLPIDPMFADTTMCFEDSPYGTYLTAGNNGSTFLWNNGSVDQNIFVNTPGYTTVTVTTANGCSSTFGITIYELCLGDYIYVPNAFTPNSDGINDVFQVKGTAVESYEIIIWNRWGQKVFESEDMDEIWDGSFQSGDYYVESEAYVYQINYKYFDEISGEVSDWVTLDGFVSVIR